MATTFIDTGEDKFCPLVPAKSVSVKISPVQPLPSPNDDCADSPVSDADFDGRYSGETPQLEHDDDANAALLEPESMVS